MRWRDGAGCDPNDCAGVRVPQMAHAIAPLPTLHNLVADMGWLLVYCGDPIHVRCYLVHGRGILPVNHA
jgi:hypothetical protein